MPRGGKSRSSCPRSMVAHACGCQRSVWWRGSGSAAPFVPARRAFSRGRGWLKGLLALRWSSTFRRLAPYRAREQGHGPSRVSYTVCKSVHAAARRFRGVQPFFPRSAYSLLPFGVSARNVGGSQRADGDSAQERGTRSTPRASLGPVCMPIAKRTSVCTPTAALDASWCSRVAVWLLHQRSQFLPILRRRASLDKMQYRESASRACMPRQCMQPCPLCILFAG